jgi:hypothetical protein
MKKNVVGETSNGYKGNTWIKHFDRELSKEKTTRQKEEEIGKNIYILGIYWKS